MNWFILALRNTFNFKDRARRREYGWFLVGNAVIGLFIALLEFAGLFLGVNELLIVIYILNLIISIPLWIAAISITTRRLHDLGYSGWWQCLPIVIALIIFLASFLITSMQPSSDSLALIGGGFAVVFALLGLLLLGFGIWLIFKDGQRFENKYGKDPKFSQDIENDERIFLNDKKSENKVIQKF